MTNPIHIDAANGLNTEILACLALPLGAASPKLITQFEAFVANLNQDAAGIGTQNAMPVYADPVTGIILAAVCGAAGIALRLPTIMKTQLLKAGCKEYLEYKSGLFQKNNRFEFNKNAAQSDHLWVVTQASPAEVTMARYGLMSVRQALRPAPVQKAAPELTLEIIDLPKNAAALAYLKMLKPNGGTMSVDIKKYGPYGGYHPDVSDFMWNKLTDKAGIESEGWLIFSKLGLVHPKSKAIYAFLKDEGVFAMRLPDTATAIAAGANVYPEVGEGWIYFPLMSLQEHSAHWLAQSYQYAATL